MINSSPYSQIGGSPGVAFEKEVMSVGGNVHGTSRVTQNKVTVTLWVRAILTPSTLLFFIAASNMTTLSLDNVGGPYAAERPMDLQCALHKPSTLLDHLDNCPHLRSLTLDCIMLDLDLFLRCLRCLPSSHI